MSDKKIIRLNPDGPLLIVGAGQQGRVVLDILTDAGLEHLVEGFIDTMENRSIHGKPLDGKPVLGGSNTLQSSYDKGIRNAVVAIGDCFKRSNWAHVLQQIGYRMPIIKHPTATISSRAEIGDGSMLHAGSIVCSGAIVGICSIINTGASVDHDCIIGNFCHIAPGVRLSGCVVVGEHSLIGVGAAIRNEVRIGARSVVGAGAAVVSDIPDEVVAVGVPARVIRTNRIAEGV